MQRIVCRSSLPLTKPHPLLETARILPISSATCSMQRCNFKARFYPRSCSKRQPPRGEQRATETLPANRHKKERVIKKGVAGHLLRPKTQVAIGSILCTHNSWKTTRQKNSIVRMFGKVPEAMLIINNSIYCDEETGWTVPP